MFKLSYGSIVYLIKHLDVINRVKKRNNETGTRLDLSLSFDHHFDALAKLWITSLKTSQDASLFHCSSFLLYLLHL